MRKATRRQRRRSPGENSGKPKLTLAQVDAMRDMREYGGLDRPSWRELARLFKVSREAAAAICKYRRRATA